MNLPLPNVDFEDAPFWTGGAAGQLLIARCGACSYWIHPPSPLCPMCLSDDVRPHSVSGNGTVLTYTVNWQPWLPHVPVPYILAVVTLVEQADLRIATQLIDIEPDAVKIDMPVHVQFVQNVDVWLPFFTPGEKESNG